ncbi:MAG: HEAT repeat domain-containing protein [Ignavibacteria bacterium]|jgi:hypothetical protein
MKKLNVVLVVLFAIILATASQAKSSSNENSKENHLDVTDIVKNLEMGTKSDNFGLKVSSTYELGNYNTSRSIINLMRVLHDDKDVEARIAAALSLIKIGDARGVYAVKRAATFDESQRVRKLCSKFYSDFILANKN